MKKAKKTNTLQQVKAYTKYWQKQLRMLDWKLTVEVEEDPKKFECFGRMKHDRNNMTATLIVLNPEKIPEDWSGIRDLEVTVVHELVHTRFIFCFTPVRHNYHQEMAIETCAKAMVALRRGIDPEDLV